MSIIRCSTFLGAAVAALLVYSTVPAWAGTFNDDGLVLSVEGDGFIFSDPDEGVLAPGIKSVTTDPNADYPNTNNPSGIENCLMANNPDIVCTAEQGSGKRIKTRLTGPGGMDIQMATQASGGITEYYTFGKTSNLTGARILGFEVVLGTGTGSDFTPMDPSDPAAAALFDPDFNPRFNLPDGLFGNGGQEDAGIGFFDGDRAEMTVTPDGATLVAADLVNGAHLANFGDGLLDDTMVPDAYFWDSTGTAVNSEEPVLVAWNNVGVGQWQYGNLGVAAPTDPDVLPLDVRLQSMADSLGVTVAELGYSVGGAVPDEIVALMEQQDTFTVDVIEDLRNMNLNFIIDLGDVAGNGISIRLLPVFADVVQLAQTQFQFDAAAQLDAAANVPYFDLGNSAVYQAGIAEILGLSGAAQVEALERTNFSFLSAFSGLGLELGRSQILALGMPSATPGDGATMSTKGETTKWQMGQNSWGFASLRGAWSEYDTTAGSIGYKVFSGSFNAGYEVAVSERLTFGAQIGAVDGTADAYNGRGNVDANGVSVSAFGRLGFGDGGAVQAVVGYQDLSFDTQRSVFGLTASGDTDGSQTFAALQASYMFDSGALSIGPMASIEHYSMDVDGFNETGAGAWNLSVGGQSGDISVGSVGVQGAYDLPKMKLTGSLTYNMASGDDQLIQTGFIGLPGPGIAVSGIDTEWFGIGLGLNTELATSGNARTMLEAGYLGSFGDDYESHAVQIAVKVAF